MTRPSAAMVKQVITDFGLNPNDAAVVSAIITLLTRADERATELLAANNAEVDRRRAAEHEVERLRALVETKPGGRP